MKRYLLFLLIASMATGCNNEADPETNKAYFTRIYDNDHFNTSYFPIDIKQTPDEGYLVLGGRRLADSNFSGIYLLKVDATGEFVSEVEVQDDLVNPVGPLMVANDQYFFFAMNTIALQTQLVTLNSNGEITNVVEVGGSYPSAAAQDGTNFLLLNYDHVNKLTVLSVVNPAGSILQSKGFTIGAGDAVEEPIINHFLRTGRQLPFQVGKAGSLYFFNGFYNYTLSVVFTNLNQDDPVGVIQGQQENGGLSYLVPTAGSQFAAARFNFGDNYLLPSVSLTTSGVSSSTNLTGNYMPELVPDAPVKIISATIEGSSRVIYASNTRNRQIALIGYDPADGSLLGTRYLGFSNTFEVAALTVTHDNGLVVCGTTFLAGRFPRICIFKLSEAELAKSF
ncbi:MAG: hypothetical protein ACOYXA_09660 [Bacteroidota bacterium]